MYARFVVSNSTKLVNLKIHLRSHKKRKPHVCEICAKAFSERGSLTVHLRIHRNEKPYVCEVCSKAFTQLCHLKTHLRTHTEEKPYVCEVCCKAFTVKDHLAGHLRTRTKEKPYVCEVCSKAFTQLCNLKKHLRTHTKEKPYVCEVCDATCARVARARSSSNFFTVIFSPTDYESKSSGIHIHPLNFLLHKQISRAENHRDSGDKAIYTDGSKTEEGNGSSYCILENYGIIASWQGKLDHSNSGLQAEILAIEATSSLHRPIKIWTDNLSSLMFILNTKSHHSMVQEIQTLFLSHKHIHLRWLKAHVGYIGNECADQRSYLKSNPFFLPEPLSYLKYEIKSAVLNIWQDNWDNGETGRSTHDIVPRVSNKPVGWNREEIMFATGHRPFPSYLQSSNT
ncbi:Endothelial zinc finger protein induced by tumor necrosis factor alpha [Araneus ventricosus]|uniref:Endothelial zinc finger protein induced by tumor necrosis factor alpha n=1 Tax=Araneus ventricosus TaxID=182803 RepID=A0A4Y2SK30_ARAVE|nr:Endothelial zinc finger protein induced by tumor necrosis factor alpha [Araneus ventricosus]